MFDMKSASLSRSLATRLPRAVPLSSITVARVAEKPTDTGLTTRSRALAPFVVLIYLLGAATLAIGTVTATWSSEFLWRTGLLIVIAAGYREATARVELLRQFLQLRTSSPPRSDQSSIWTFAAAVTLPLGWAAAVVTTVLIHTCVRAQRHRSLRLHRMVFSRSMTLLGVAAAWVIGELLHAHHAGGAAQAGILIAQLLAYTGVSLMPGVTYLYLERARGQRPPVRTLLPGRHDLALELASLCIGAVVAILLLDNPWLTPLGIVLALVIGRATNAGDAAAQARTDTKTGALTASAWNEAVTSQLERRAGAVLLLDLDHFKHVNDTYGHLAGDQLLTVVGAALRGQLRDQDLLGRFGGEEFTVWLPGAGSVETAAVAERLRACVAALRLEHQQSTITTSISIGWAHLASAGSLSATLAAADEAMYAAKDAGRNLVRRARTAPGTIVGQL